MLPCGPPWTMKAMGYVRAGSKSDGLDDVPVDRLAIPAGERELLRLLRGRRRRSLDAFSRVSLPMPTAFEDVQVGRAGQRVAGCRRPRRRRPSPARRGRRRRAASRPGGDVDARTGLAGRCPRRGRTASAHRPTIRALSTLRSQSSVSRRDVAVRPAADDDRQLVRFVAGPVHREVGQRSSRPG